jgi:hypothetical protein
VTFVVLVGGDRWGGGIPRRWEGFWSWFEVGDGFGGAIAGVGGGGAAGEWVCLTFGFGTGGVFWFFGNRPQPMSERSPETALAVYPADDGVWRGWCLHVPPSAGGDGVIARLATGLGTVV